MSDGSSLEDVHICKVLGGGEVKAFLAPPITLIVVFQASEALVLGSPRFLSISGREKAVDLC